MPTFTHTQFKKKIFLKVEKPTLKFKFFNLHEMTYTTDMARESETDREVERQRWRYRERAVLKLSVLG